MNIKKLIGIAAVSVALVAGATYAYSAESETQCAIGTKAMSQELLSKIDGVHTRMLSPSEQQKIIDAKGPPPNAAEGGPLEFELVENDETGAVNIYQDGCFINKLGPASIHVIEDILGISHG